MPQLGVHRLQIKDTTCCNEDQRSHVPQLRPGEAKYINKIFKISLCLHLKLIQKRKIVLVTQLCPTLCKSMDYSPPGSSVHGIFKARILEWVAISFSRNSSQVRDQTWASCISCLGRQILYHCTTWEAHLISRQSSKNRLLSLCFILTMTFYGRLYSHPNKVRKL